MANKKPVISRRLQSVCCCIGTLCMLVVSSNAQVLDTLWTHEYTFGSGNYTAINMWEKKDGGFLISGYLARGVYNELLPWFINTTSSGDSIGSNLRSRANEINAWVMECRDNSICFANTDTIFKFDSQGRQLWRTTMDTFKVANRIIETSDGGLICVANQLYFPNSAFAVFRLNPDGSLAWKKVFQNERNYLFCRAVIALRDGNYLIAKDGNSVIVNDSLYLLKISPLGTALWTKTVNLDLRNQGDDISITTLCELSDGRFIAGGMLENEYGMVCMFSSTGQKIWQKNYYSIHNSGINDGLALNDSTLLVTQYSGSILGSIKLSDTAHKYDTLYQNRSRIPTLRIANVVKVQSGGFAVTVFEGMAPPMGYDACFLFRLLWNYPPTITSTKSGMDTTIFEDQQYLDTVQASDPFPGDICKFKLLQNTISGLTIDSLTGMVSWTPQTSADSGDHPVTVIATDRVGQKDTLSYNLHVQAVNDPPKITGIHALKNPVTEGDTMRLAATLTDEEGGHFTYQWTCNGTLLPGTDSIGLKVLDYLSAGPLYVSLSVTDGGNIVTFLDTITVQNKGLPPQFIDSANSVFKMTDPVRWNWHTTIRDPDLDPQTLLYRVMLSGSGAVNGMVFRKDSINDTTIRINSILGTEWLMGNRFYAQVMCSDAKGYSTGWSAPTLYSLLFDSSMAQIITKPLAGSSTVGFTFNDGMILTYTPLVAAQATDSLTVTYFGYKTCPLSPTVNSHEVRLNRKYSGTQATVTLSSAHITSGTSILRYNNSQWLPCAVNFHVQGQALETIVPGLANLATVPDGTVLTDVMPLVNKPLPKQFSIKGRGNNVVLSVPALSTPWLEGRLNLFDITGRKIKSIRLQYLSPGENEVECGQVRSAVIVAQFVSRQFRGVTRLYPTQY